MKTLALLAALSLILASTFVPADASTGHKHASGAPHSRATAASAALPRADGEIRKVDLKAQKVTLRHSRIENLNMSPMTMVYRVKDPAWLKTLKPGDKIRFAAERVNGYFTIVAVERVL